MIKYGSEAYRELRCPKCRALLCEEYIYTGRLRIKCPRCKEISTFRFRTPKSVLQDSADN